MLGQSGEGLPKPLQLVGDLPLMVHAMNHYVAYGHTGFVLCLGHTANQIQDIVSLVVTDHPRARHWNVEYLDTGVDTSTGERLWLARHLITGEETLFANYSDVLPDVSLDDMVEGMKVPPDAVATILAMCPNTSLHVLDIREDGTIAGSHCLTGLPIHEDGGYPILRQLFFSLLDDGRNLDVVLGALLASRQLIAYRYGGFQLPADASRECALLNAIYDSESMSWGRHDTVTVP